VSDEVNTYQLSQLELLTNDKLIEILKGNWGYSNHEPIMVVGTLTIIKMTTHKLYFLENIKNIKTGQLLTYPLEGQGVEVNVRAFVGREDVKIITARRIEGNYVKAALTLSPNKERKKHNNPLEVCVADKTASSLTEVPKEWDRNAYEDDESIYIEQWAVDQFYQRNNQEIAGQKDELLAKLKQEKESLESDKLKEEREFELFKKEQLLKSQDLEQENQKLQSNIDDKGVEIKNAEGRIEANLKKHQKLIQEQRVVGQALKQEKLLLQHFKITYQERMKEMENKLERLKGFIQEKSKILIELGLLDEKEHMKLVGKQAAEDEAFGYGLSEHFDDDYKKTASYIQAFMNKKGIYYHRSVIEDFFALLRTNDLIILAGDSGSGKTNLVKSFAEAIGGKSFIIPVKPNWTSAEDLLGYYNPLEKKYVITAFLSALIEAEANPNVPYLICLDEMNLARVEYYFADFLSLLEERNKQPEIFLYSDDEASHTLEEYKTFLRLIEKVKSDHKDKELVDFVDFLQDEDANIELHKLCGFHEGDSLLNYHSKLRRILSGFINTPSSIKLPNNVRIIGAINVDDTTHYLSPKILDRAHVIKFSNPFLMDLNLIKSEVDKFDELDLTKPVNINVEQLGQRTPYPELDENNELVKVLITLGKDYLCKLGVEFGFRTVRQAQNYAVELSLFSTQYEVVLNNFILHKVLPKLMFEGEQKVGSGGFKKDVLQDMSEFLTDHLSGLVKGTYADNSVEELKLLIANSEANDWLVNYWIK